MKAQRFSSYWKELKGSDKVQLALYLFAISAWAGALMLRIANSLAGIIEGPWYKMELHIAFLYLVSVAAFLRAMRGKGSLSNRLIRNFEEWWVGPKRKTAIAARCRPHNPEMS